MDFDRRLFYFDDKDIYDVLVSDKKRIPFERLVQFLLRKGIVVSRATGRQELCGYIATWFRDYQTLEALSLGEQKKRETTKYEPEEIATKNPEVGIAVEDIRTAVEQLKEMVARNGQVLVVEHGNDGKTTNLVWTRNVIDHTQTPLRQRKDRSDGIQIVHAGNGKVFIRTSVDESCGDLKTQFVEKLQDVSGHELERMQIRIKENASPEERIKFFLDVLNGMPSFQPQTVIVEIGRAHV